jgi:CheY-like chemotaxis protein
MGKQRILLVDDDAKLSSLVRIILERVGHYSVREENRSFAAIETALEFRPHLCILDVNMPGKDGGDVATEIRNHPILRETPVIFLTSLCTPNDTGMHGGTRFLSKPVDPKQLLSAVKSMMLEMAV